MLICTAAMQQKSLDQLLPVINSSGLSDQRFWLLWLLCKLNLAKLRKHVPELFAVLALSIASGVNEPFLSTVERIKLIKAQAI